MLQQAPAGDDRQQQTLADWTRVYDGLSDEEIESIDKRHQDPRRSHCDLP